MKTDRLLALLSILSETDRITVRELSSRLEVSRRTIFRDLESLGCAGIPVFSFIGPGGGVSILDSYKLKYKVLSTDDKEKIYTALRGLRSIDNDSSVTHLIAKLVPEQESAVFSQSDCVIDLSSWFDDSIIHKKISFLRSAIQTRSLVRMEYVSRSSRGERIIEPHKLVFKQSCWYIYGYCRRKNAFRLFRLSRIASLETLDESFTPRSFASIPFPQGCGADFCHGEGESSPHKKSPVPPYQVRLEYHISDEFELTKTFDATYFQRSPDSSSHLGHICFQTWDLDFAEKLVFGLLDKVRVISPPQLSQQIRCRLEKIIPLYKGDT